MPDISKENLKTIEPLLHPIIYVRGYAMSEDERDETSADPFCGFNLGSTVYRANVDKQKRANKFIFESPVVRLMSDFGYTDVYENGLDIMDDGWQGQIAYRSIIIYRYYDQGSGLLGDGKSSPISEYAKGLSALIAKVRDLVVDENGKGIANFKCYLVAHSMGGLVCRAFLQNAALGDATVRTWVDKVYTYATPHNGIEMAGINVPTWLSSADMNNFNRDNMSKYLALDQDPDYPTYRQQTNGRVDFLGGFPLDRFFCMVGTNRADYNVAAGLSRTFAGNGSDGLVKIDNAVLYGQKSGEIQPCPSAYTYRSHSGFFGIVNAEEAFQNLTRFLYGDLRVDIWFDFDSVTLPQSLQPKAADVTAAYLLEIKAGPKGKPWHLTRRITEEDSVAVRTHKELTTDAARKQVYLSTVFLSRWAKIDQTNDKLSYSVSLAIGVQEYLVKGIIFDSHYEGVKLFSDTLIVSILPGLSVEWHWGQDSDTGTHTFTNQEKQSLLAGKPTPLSIDIPAIVGKAPGITGKLRFIATHWNI